MHKNNMAEKDLTSSQKLWMSVSQSANICGVDQKTVRRAIKARQVSYIVEDNRYKIEIGSLITWVHKSKKLENKLNYDGIGKFVKEWKEEYKK